VIRVAIKFGTFVLVCLFFTGYLAFTIGNLKVTDPLGRDTYHVTATFNDATGLLLNDNVKVAGVVVGKVTSIKVDKGKAVVGFEVSNDHRDIPKDSRAAIRWRNLIGQRYVYLYPGSSPQALRGGDRITQTASAVDLGELFNRLGPIVGAIDPAQVNKLLETLTQAFDGREGEIGKALDDLAVLTKGLASRDEAIGRLVTNLDTVAATINSRDTQIKSMIDNLVSLSDSFADNTTTLAEALDEFSSFATDVDHLLTNNGSELDRLLAHLAEVTDTVHKKLPEVDKFLARFGDAAAAVWRAGNRGEFLNQKILCVALGPPASSEAGCPTGDPVVGLSASGATFTGRPTGAAAVTSLLTKAIDR
jgi:phospholipid/cholesterol/gamma-HCH transport system substrate-binding protein